MLIQCKLEPGKALIICGKAASGKSTLACEIAAANGTSITTTFCELTSPFGIGRILVEEKPNTIIVEEIPLLHKTLGRLKTFVANDYLEAEVKGKDPVFVKTPNFIFVYEHADPILLDDISRRFTILKI